tara:strand:+ start:43 stop:924 length:882 start_codon:yes stop_codon:yes gene_type:complete
MFNRVLIFGIDSFTGFYLKQKLISEKFDVIGTSLLKESEYFCDITSKSNCIDIIKKTQPNYLINLAGVSFVPNSDLEKMYKVNLLGPLNIMESLVQTNVNPINILFASSAQLYNYCDGEMISEKSNICSVNHYSNSKMSMEKMLDFYKTDFNINILRPFNYTGLGQNDNFIVPKIVSHFKNKKTKIHLGDIDVSRDFSDVRDVVDAYFRVMKYSLNSEYFNICSGKSIFIRDLLDMVSNITNHSLEIVQDESFKRKNLIKHLLGDNSKLKSIGWSPFFDNFNDTLKWMVNGND